MLDLSTMNWNSEVPTFCNSTTKQYLLKIDEACFTFHHINNKYATQELEIWGQSSKCQEVVYTLKYSCRCSTYDLNENCVSNVSCFMLAFPQCPMWKFASVKSGQTAVLAVNTTYPTLFQVKQNELSVCK